MIYDQLEALNMDNYGMYNRHVMKKLDSLTAACFLSELIQKRCYFRNREMLIDHIDHGKGWFYLTLEDAKDRVGLSREEQNTAIKILIEYGLIEQRNFGLPARRHFRLLDENIFEIFGFSNNHSSLRESHKLECGNPTNYDVGIPQTPHIIEDKHKEKHSPPNPQRGKTAKAVKGGDSFSKIEKKTPIRDNVTLTDQEKAKLDEMYPIEQINWMLDCLDCYKASKGVKYKSDYHVLLPTNWVAKRYNEEKPSVNHSSTPMSKAKNMLERCDNLKDCRVMFLVDSVEFSREGYAAVTTLSYKDKTFLDDFKHNLMKWGFMPKKK